MGPRVVRGRGSRLALAALAVQMAACGAPGRVPDRAQHSDERNPALEIHLELDRNQFIVGEALNVTVVISNTGAEELEVPDPEANVNWQPSYTVAGPSYPEGYTFHFRGVVRGDPGPAPEGVEPITVRLAPGETYSGQLPLERLVKFPTPGPHTVSATLEWKGSSARSESVPFVLARPKFLAFQLLAASGLQETYPIRVVCLVEGDPQPQLYMALFNEMRPDLGEISLSSLVHVATPAGAARSVFGPWTNYTGIGTPSPRSGWQEGARLGVEAFRQPSLQITLDAEPRLVRPALMPPSGELDVIALEPGEPVLSLVRFPPTEASAGDAAPGPAVVWKLPLPATPVAARAALAPASLGSGRTAVLLTARAGEAGIVLVGPARGDAAPRVRSVTIDDLRPLPGADPAIHITENGTVHVAALFSADAQNRDVRLLELQWPEGAERPTGLQIERAATLPAAPRAAAIAYSVAPAGTPRRDWVVLLEDGRTLNSRSPQEPHALNGEPVVPLELLPMSQMSYLLTIHPREVLRFELLY